MYIQIEVLFHNKLRYDNNILKANSVQPGAASVSFHVKFYSAFLCILAYSRGICRIQEAKY